MGEGLGAALAVFLGGWRLRFEDALGVSKASEEVDGVDAVDAAAASASRRRPGSIRQTCQGGE